MWAEGSRFHHWTDAARPSQQSPCRGMEREYHAIAGPEHAYCCPCPTYRDDEATPTCPIVAQR
ncbi:hypothetical protein E2C01_055235 [Portunus trituberculatus]|uniref:Uncharacterized protein n=1 Tax=Portunus trituberculatus TaxID=210409 RepID=A0A5B7GM77_PORTR|nr:hypothetical protein [Portunus trituberculatus]